MLVIILPFILLRSFLVGYLWHERIGRAYVIFRRHKFSAREYGVTRNDDDNGDNDEHQRVIKNDLMKYIVRSIYIDLPWMFINPSLECLERQKKYGEIPEEEKASTEFGSYSMGLRSSEACTRQKQGRTSDC